METLGDSLLSNGSTKWHGFADYVQLGKATLTLGGMICTGVWVVLTLMLDGRYAPAAIAKDVEANGKVVSDVREQLTDVKAFLVESQVLDTKSRICNAASVEARKHFVNQLQGLISQYRNIKGEQPYIPDCEDLR